MPSDRTFKAHIVSMSPGTDWIRGAAAGECDRQLGQGLARRRLELDELDPNHQLFSGISAYRVGRHRPSPHLASPAAACAGDGGEVSVALTSSTAVDSQRAIIVAALLATFMESVNISIPNAALPHIQGTLSMSDDEAAAFTAYIAAGTVMPMASCRGALWPQDGSSGVPVLPLGLMLNTLARRPDPVCVCPGRRKPQALLAPLSLAILLDVLPPAPRRIGLVDRVLPARHQY